MAKVIFEFDEFEDKEDINRIVNRDKLISALEKVADLRSKIYNSKFYNNELISVKDGKILTDEDYKNALNEQYSIGETDDYVSREYLENTLGSILDSVYQYLEY